MERANQFWSNKKNCFAVALIYGTNESNQYYKAENLTNKINKYSISDLEKEISNIIPLAEREYMLYRSVNLSELVLVCKHDLLNSILKAIAKISYEFPNLQTHTVCGFRYDPNTGISYDTQETDIIDMVKITGTIKSYKKSLKIFNEISHQYEQPNQNTYIAFGNNDFNLIYENVNTSDIISILNNWSINYNDVNDAFSSIKTRVHVKYRNEQVSDGSFETNHNIQTLINEVQSSVLKCRNLQDLHSKWVYPFVETLNMLSDMYNNPELSRIRYFTLDTLMVLNRALNDLLNNDEEYICDYLERCEKRLNKFSTGFNTLIERIVRVDGYLSQEPGYSPLIYNMIPAGILEYYCSYLYKATQIVNEFSANDDKKYIYATLPLPELERYISFYDILPNYEQPNQSNQVNLLEVPYNELYHPERLLFSVTHEVMHFCGERTRCRNIRYDCFIDFISEYLIHEFDVIEIQKNAKAFIRTFFKNRITKDKNKTSYFVTLIPEVSNAIKDIYQNVDLKNRLQKALVKHRKDNDIEESMYWNIAWMNSMSSKMTLLYQLEDIVYLFKECYADLMTVRFLNISAANYCKLFDELELRTNNVHYDQNAVIDLQLILRKALVIYCSNDTTKVKNWLITDLCKIFENAENNKDDNDLIEAFTNKVCEDYNQFLDETDFAELFYCMPCLLSLIKYLKACNDEFDSILNSNAQNSKMVDHLREYYNTGVDPKKLFSLDYCNFLYDVRRELNEQIEQYITEINNDKNNQC